MNNNLWGLLVYSRLLIQYRGTGFKLFGWIKSTSWQRIIWLCPYKHISLSWLSWPREMVRYLELSQIHNISIFRWQPLPILLLSLHYLSMPRLAQTILQKLYLFLTVLASLFVATLLIANL